MHCSHILHVRYFRDVIFFDLFYYTLCTYGFGWSEFSCVVVFCGWVQADQGRCFFLAYTVWLNWGVKGKYE